MSLVGKFGSMRVYRVSAVESREVRRFPFLLVHESIDDLCDATRGGDVAFIVLRRECLLLLWEERLPLNLTIPDALLLIDMLLGNQRDHLTPRQKTLKQMMYA